MMLQTKIDLQYENSGGVGIFSLSGELTGDREDDLKLVLMRALYSTERAVIDFKNVSIIDDSCITLLKNAYCTSVRLRSPIIMTGISPQCAETIFECSPKQGRHFHVITDRSFRLTDKGRKPY